MEDPIEYLMRTNEHFQRDIFRRILRTGDPKLCFNLCMKNKEENKREYPGKDAFESCIKFLCQEECFCDEIRGLVMQEYFESNLGDIRQHFN
jgi:hypothetical protein